MAIKRKAYASAAETLGERQVRVICSTADVDRMGEVVVQEGLDLAAYLENPVVLWQHDPQQPIARAATVALADGMVQALVQFPGEGVSPKADEVYGLIKAGILNTVSIGFDPSEMEPMDPGQPRGPQRYRASELLEISFVSIPANRGAAVVSRQHRAALGSPRVRSLYDVGALASALSNLGWIRDDAQWEADFEGDASQVPAMLGQAMQTLGAALVAMTQEEVAELLAEADAEPEVLPEPVPLDDAVYIEAGATPAIRKFRAGLRRTRSVPAAGIPTRATRAAALRERTRRKRDAHVIALG